MAGPERQAPPVGEEIHLPGPTLVPLANALGITLAIVGLTISWLMVGLGVGIFLVSTVRWIRETRREIDELPPGH